MHFLPTISGAALYSGVRASGSKEASGSSGSVLEGGSAGSVLEGGSAGSVLEEGSDGGGVVHWLH